MAEAKVGIIGGSGLGEAVSGDAGGETLSVNTPFGRPSSDIIETRWQGTPVAILNRHGPGHLICPSGVNYRANLYALKSLGCTHVIASGAVGSLRERLRARDLVVPDQVIDKTYRRVGTFFEEGLAVHVEMAAPFCPVLRKHLMDCQDALEATVHRAGTYICMEGPAFSSRAESEMHRAWGGDLVGMTCMPEAKLAREAEIAYAMLCLVSDYDCWRPPPQELGRHELLREIIGTLRAATANAVELIKAAIGRFREIADVPSPALELAIWSNRTMISPDTKQKFGVLVDKYL